MGWNRVRIALGGAGVVVLAILAVTGNGKEPSGKTISLDAAGAATRDAIAEKDKALSEELMHQRFVVLEPQLSKKPVLLEAAAVSEVAVTAKRVPQPVKNPVILKPNQQIMVAATEEIQEVQEEPEQAEVLVVTAVEAPGNAEVEKIQVSTEVVPVSEPTPAPEPEVSQNPTVGASTLTVFSQSEQMASIQNGATSIIGSSYTYLEQMVRYYNANKVYPAFYAGTDAPTIEAFCNIYIEEAMAEGVRVEVAFCQAMKETGFLTYTGDVRIEQFNFAGIGATGGGVQGNYFASVREGIRAQIQHLKAYASTEELKTTCVDPRFGYVKRGTTPYVEWLGIQENPYGGGWAAAKNYGPSIINDYIAKLFSY